MKFSIVTISFNQKQYLKTCIDSILSQKGVELEYIVVDPGSTDGSRELIASYGEKIIQVFEPDAGPADGLNGGFAKATGDIYGFINSDDYLLPNALQGIADFCVKQKNIDSVFVTGYGLIDRGTGELSRVYPTVLTAEAMLQLADVMFQQSTFFSATLFKQAKGFNVQNRTCWDYELFLRFLTAGVKHAVIKQELAAFRLHEGSISGSGRLEELYFKDVDVLFQEIKGRPRGFLDFFVKYYLRLKREIKRKLWGTQAAE